MIHSSRHVVEKLVRFDLQDVRLDNDDENIEEENTSTPLHSPPPATPTPSPTYSLSTAESSIGLITPPNHPFVTMLDPKDSSQAGPLGSSSTSIPKLAPVLSSAFPLRWDMKEEPATIIKMLPLDGGNDQAGTMPSGEPIRRIMMVHEALVDWPLEIENPIDGEALTVHHVLSKIHEHMMKLVSVDHFMALDLEAQNAVTKRCHAREKGTKVPLRRIDYLPGRIYMGLSARNRHNECEFLLITNP